MNKHITGKILVVFTLITLSLVAVNHSSAQFDLADPADFKCYWPGGGGDPTPSATPQCYEQYYDVYETYCDYARNLCCQDHYLVIEHWCNGIMLYTEYQLLSHSCYEV